MAATAKTSAPPSPTTSTFTNHNINDLIARLRLPNDPPANAAADHIATLTERVVLQQALMDRAANILVEAMTPSDGINEVQAEACISSIRGQLADVGKTTTEHYLERICARIAATVGIATGTEFNPLTALDQIRVVLHAQQRNAEHLEWAISVLWAPADRENQPTPGGAPKGGGLSSARSREA